MVFVALYKDKGIFDIEFYLRDYEYDKEKMWSEISTRMLHRGIIQFTVDNANNPELLEEFSKDLSDIQDLRFMLYEHWHNRPEPNNVARDNHNAYYWKIKEKLKAFCDKYNFYLDED